MLNKIIEKVYHTKGKPNIEYPFRKNSIYLEILSPLWKDYDPSKPNNKITSLTTTEKQDIQKASDKRLSDKKKLVTEENNENLPAVIQDTFPLAIPIGLFGIGPDRKIYEAYRNRCDGSYGIEVRIYDFDLENNKKNLEEIALMFGVNRAWRTCYSIPYGDNSYSLWNPNNTHLTHINIKGIDFVFSGKSKTDFLGEYEEWEEKRVNVGYKRKDVGNGEFEEVDPSFTEEIRKKYELNVKNDLISPSKFSLQIKERESRRDILIKIMNSLAELAEENMVDVASIERIESLPYNMVLDVEFYRAKEIIEAE